MRLLAKYGIAVPLENIKRDNTGLEEIINYDLEHLEANIDGLIKAAGRYYYANENNTAILKVYSKHTYLAYRKEPLQNMFGDLKDEDVKNFLKDYDNRFKKPLKRLLIEYYRLTLNPEIELKGTLLEHLGFKACRNCYSVDGAQ